MTPPFRKFGNAPKGVQICKCKEEDAAQRYQTRDPWLNIDQCESQHRFQKSTKDFEELGTIEPFLEVSDLRGMYFPKWEAS